MKQLNRKKYELPQDILPKQRRSKSVESVEEKREKRKLHTSLEEFE